MSDLMLYGVLRMPYDLTMANELSRRQFYSRVQEASDRLEAADTEIADLRAELASRCRAQGGNTSAKPVESGTVPTVEVDEMPPIEYDKALDRTYIPLPGGWEIQTKGNGSTFRIAHIGSRTRWMVLDDNLHEPLEALARDMRNAIASKPPAREAAERQSIDTPKFRELLSAFKNSTLGFDYTDTVNALIAYIDTWGGAAKGESDGR